MLVRRGENATSPSGGILTSVSSVLDFIRDDGKGEEEIDEVAMGRDRGLDTEGRLELD